MPLYGVVTIRMGDQTLELAGEVEYDIGGPTYETVMGTRRPLGQKVTPTAPYVSCTLQDHEDVPLRSLKGVRDKNITVHLENGKTIVIRGAAQIGPLPVNGSEGSIPIRFEGLEGEEVSA